MVGACSWSLSFTPPAPALLESGRGESIGSLICDLFTLSIFFVSSSPFCRSSSTPVLGTRCAAQFLDNKDREAKLTRPPQRGVDIFNLAGRGPLANRQRPWLWRGPALSFKRSSTLLPPLPSPAHLKRPLTKSRNAFERIIKRRIWGQLANTNKIPALKGCLERLCCSRNCVRMCVRTRVRMCVCEWHYDDDLTLC